MTTTGSAASIPLVISFLRVVRCPAPKRDARRRRDITYRVRSWKCTFALDSVGQYNRCMQPSPDKIGSADVVPSAWDPRGGPFSADVGTCLPQTSHVDDEVRLLADYARLIPVMVALLHSARYCPWFCLAADWCVADILIASCSCLRIWVAAKQ